MRYNSKAKQGFGHRVAALVALTLLAGCSKATASGEPPRSYRMGFAGIGPRAEFEITVEAIHLWSTRADAAIILLTPPWKAMLADTAPSVYVRREQYELVKYYRGKGMKVVVMIDATDGLSRDKEHPDLVALGRSITEPAIRALFREVAIAADTILHPDHLGLAMETNMIRALAPSAVYDAMVVMVNDAATALKGRGTTAKLFTSVQVETAWGKLPFTGKFEGIAKDRADFAFNEALGLSSYPYFAGFGTPENIPIDYYQRLMPDGALPLLIVEGGWASAAVGEITSSPELQARYIARHMRIADRAKVAFIFQLTFTDLDIASLGDVGPQLLPFASLGLVDFNLAPKPALAEWDRAFARRLEQ